MRHRWIYIDGEAINANEFEREPQADFHVMPDIQPYQSMADGSMITSRSQHREHLAKHGLVEIGNETKYLVKHKKQIPSAKPQLIEAVQRAKEQHGSRYVERAITESLQKAYEVRHRR